MPISAADAQAVEKVLSKESLVTYARTINMLNTRQALTLYAWNAEVGVWGATEQKVHLRNV